MRTKDYQSWSIIKVSDGLFGMAHIRYGRQLWSKVNVRKEHQCTMTGKTISKGSSAYRPITDKGNRYERIIPDYFEANI